MIDQPFENWQKVTGRESDIAGDDKFALGEGSVGMERIPDRLWIAQEVQD